MLSDAKKQSAVEQQLIKKSEVLGIMNETVYTNNLLLGEMKDIMYNIRADVKTIHPLKEEVGRIKTELTQLQQEINKLEEIKYLKNFRLQR